MTRKGPELHPSTHWLRCRHVIGSAEYTYSMPCDVIKEMPGMRLKIRVYGNRCWGGNRSRIRYVPRSRVRSREGYTE